MPLYGSTARGINKTQTHTQIDIPSKYYSIKILAIQLWYQKKKKKKDEGKNKTPYSIAMSPSSNL